MRFHSFDYLFFFLAVVGLRFVRPPRLRKPLLLVASLFFYMFWNPVFMAFKEMTDRHSSLLAYAATDPVAAELADGRGRYKHLHLNRRGALLFTRAIADTLRARRWL